MQELCKSIWIFGSELIRSAGRKGKKMGCQTENWRIGGAALERKKEKTKTNSVVRLLCIGK